MNTEAKRPVLFRRIQGTFSHITRLEHGNFEDPNLTVPCPILTIHGNHDDPTGPDAQSVCKKLATCGLLNYFGQNDSQTSKMVVEPIILQKGDIKIAIYGMGFMPDFKLRQAFEKGNVKFTQPPEDSFNILVVHQNRIPLSKTKYIPDEFYPKFIHLLVRGHEHATQAPELIPDSLVDGLVYQPGSTVATSISVMEAEPKRVGLFSISKKNTEVNRFKIDYNLIDLKSSRPMILKDISQKDISKYVKGESGQKKLTANDYQKYSQKYILDNIRAVLKEYNTKRVVQTTGDQLEKDKNSDLPLLRFRLEYISKNERFDELEISKEFYPEQVANKDIILFKKQKLSKTADGQVENVTFVSEDSQDTLEDFECIDLDEEKKDTIDVMIEGYFKDKPADERLKVLSLSEYTSAVRGSSEDGNVISKVLAMKKQNILHEYAKAIRDEEVAERNFHDEEKVEKWFLDQMNDNETIKAFV